MSDSKQHDDSFKVVDRRPFTAEGELRPDAADEKQKREAQPAVGTPSAAKPQSAAGAAGAAPAEAPQQVLTTDAAQIKPSRGFESLVNFIAQNAAMVLGAYPDPRTGQPIIDLEGARELIDMLDALRDATRGNLAAEDDRLLLDVLGSLKLSFMEMTKAAAKAIKEKAPPRT
ncbi:MAG: DUF1844 domain-containing protein [Candidatus Acidiferrales bacterium]